MAIFKNPKILIILVARLDVQTMRAMKERQKIESSQASQRYHVLAYIHEQVNTPKLKAELADSHPEISAQIFYHFDDRELGNYLAKRYIAHQNDTLREMASSVIALLQKRSAESERLESILGMRSIPVFGRDGDREFDEEYRAAYFDTSLMKSEEYAR